MHVTTKKGRTIFTYEDGEVYLAMDKAGRTLDRKKMTFDEVEDIVDSAFACRVIKALQEKLEPAELDRVLQILTDADIIKDNEREAVSKEVGAEADGPRETEAAMDSAFPHRRRLGGPVTYSADSARRLDEIYGTGRIKQDPYQPLPPGHGDNPNPRGAVDDALLDSMFPDRHRLKA